MCDLTWTQAIINVVIVIGSWEGTRFVLSRLFRWIEGGSDA